MYVLVELASRRSNDSPRPDARPVAPVLRLPAHVWAAAPARKHVGIAHASEDRLHLCLLPAPDSEARR